MKVVPTRNITGDLGFKLIAENETEKNLLTEFETTTITATTEISDNLVQTIDLVGT